MARLRATQVHGVASRLASLGRLGFHLALLVAVSASCSENKKTTEPDPPLPDPVASIVLTPFTASVVVSDTVRIAAVLKSAAGTVLSDRSIQWATSDLGTATVSTTGGVVDARVIAAQHPNVA